MVKTRSQSQETLVKKDESDDESKHNILLNGVSSTTKTRGLIAKKRTSQRKNRYLSIPNVKLEEGASDHKMPLRRSVSGHLTQEQINQFIGFIENDGLSVPAASRKVNFSRTTGLRYYNLYKKHPEQKIPAPWRPTTHTKKKYSQDQIKALINHVVNDKMTVFAASKKLNISRSSGDKYYHLYMKNPEQAIPAPKKQFMNSYKNCTEEQIQELIRLIVVDKISLSKATKKVKIGLATGFKYYRIYKSDPERKIPLPYNRTEKSSKFYTQDQIKALIDYIVKDKMSISEASRRLNMGIKTGQRYYKIYKNDPEKKIPKPGQHYVGDFKPCAQDKIEAVISHIVNDEMSVPEAARKAKISLPAAYKYYYKYKEEAGRKNPKPQNRKSNATNFQTQDQINSLISYIENDKMSIIAASGKAGMCGVTGRKYYDKYLNDPERNIPKAWEPSMSKNKPCTDDQLEEFFKYIVQDKISIAAAAKKINISCYTGYKYYRMYMNDSERKIPTPSKQMNNPHNACPQEKINKLIDLVENENLTVSEASRRVNIGKSTGLRYYNRYKDDPEQKIPERFQKISEDQAKAVVDYIVKDKMSFRGAARLTNMAPPTARRYYSLYLEGQKSKKSATKSQSTTE